MEPSFVPSYKFPSRRNTCNLANGLANVIKTQALTTVPSSATNINIETGLQPTTTVPIVPILQTLDVPTILPLSTPIYVQPSLAAGLAVVTEDDQNTHQVVKILSANNALKRKNPASAEHVLGRYLTAEEHTAAELSPETRTDANGTQQIVNTARGPFPAGKDFVAKEQEYQKMSEAFEDKARLLGVPEALIQRTKTRFNMLVPNPANPLDFKPAKWNDVLDLISFEMNQLKDEKNNGGTKIQSNMPKGLADLRRQKEAAKEARFAENYVPPEEAEAKRREEFHAPLPRRRPAENAEMRPILSAAERKEAKEAEEQKEIDWRVAAREGMDTEMKEARPRAPKPVTQGLLKRFHVLKGKNQLHKLTDQQKESLIAAGHLQADILTTNEINKQDLLADPNLVQNLTVPMQVTSLNDIREGDENEMQGAASGLDAQIPVESTDAIMDNIQDNIEPPNLATEFRASAGQQLGMDGHLTGQALAQGIQGTYLQQQHRPKPAMDLLNQIRTRNSEVKLIPVPPPNMDYLNERKLQEQIPHNLRQNLRDTNYSRDANEVLWEQGETGSLGKPGGEAHALKLQIAGIKKAIRAHETRVKQGYNRTAPNYKEVQRVYEQNLTRLPPLESHLQSLLTRNVSEKRFNDSLSHIRDIVGDSSEDSTWSEDDKKNNKKKRRGGSIKRRPEADHSLITHKRRRYNQHGHLNDPSADGFYRTGMPMSANLMSHTGDNAVPIAGQIQVSEQHQLSEAPVRQFARHPQIAEDITSELIPAITYAGGKRPFGKYMINHAKLREGVLSLSNHKGRKVGGMPNRVLTPEQQRALTHVIERGGSIKNKKWSDDTRTFLHHLAKKSGLNMDNMPKLKTQKAAGNVTDAQRLATLTGEAAAGNDNISDEQREEIHRLAEICHRGGHISTQHLIDIHNAF